MKKDTNTKVYAAIFLLLAWTVLNTHLSRVDIARLDIKFDYLAEHVRSLHKVDLAIYKEN